MKRSLLPVFAVSFGLAALPALAQESLLIDHKAIGCIVAEQYPQMSACLTRRPRWPRRECTSGPQAPHFYFVSGTNVLACFGYVLLPKKTIKKIDYYVEGRRRSTPRLEGLHAHPRPSTTWTWWRARPSARRTFRGPA